MKKIRLLLSFFLLIFVGGGYAFAQGLVTVSGIVTSSDANEPLIGVTIVTGPNSGVITQIDGSYSLSVAAGTTITFRYMGYESQQYTVPAGNAKITHNVVLRTDSHIIDDVVVVAYGVRKKGTIAGSVSTVKADKLENVPAASFDQALQGITPGLTILSKSGEPSATASFKIRGTNSINSGNDPLFILDGMPISASDFNTINPNDIESVSVLKDASSTSIYGARAANGVMVITTKRGRMADKALVTYRMQYGFSQLASGKWNLMNTDERIQYEKEVGLTERKDYNKLSKINTNWLEEIFNDRAPLQSHEVQVSGATEKTNYYLSGSFYTQDGTTSDSDFLRYNFRTNLENRLSSMFKVGANIMLAYEKIHESVSGGDYYTNTPISASRFMLPYVSPYKADGSLASVNDGSWKTVGENPLEWSVNNPYYLKKYKVLASLFAEAKPIEGLTLRVQGGIDYGNSRSNTISIPSYLPNNYEGKAGQSTATGVTLTITNTANYTFDIKDKHHFNAMLGQEGVNYSTESFGVGSAGQNNDFLSGVKYGTRVTSWNSSKAEYAFLSFFGRGEYTYDDRFYFDGSLRTDGSSRFGKNGRFATFWSLGFMWNVKNEKFLKSIKWLTNAQIAVSTGTTGNSSIPNYAHHALLGGVGNYLNVAGVGPISQGNEDLEWEKLWSSNLAFRLGFFNRANVEIELYNKKTTNMLMSVPESYASGKGGFHWDNVGAMINRGVELNVNVDVIQKKNFTWNISANASYNYNEITELYNGLNEYVTGTTSTKLMVGHSYGEFFLNRYAGVNIANGDALWYTKDGEITTKYNEADKVMVGKSCIAPWQGGFGTTASYKDFSLSAQFSWVANRYMMNNDRFFEEGGGLFDSYNQSKRMLYNRWKEPGDITDIPRHGVSPQFDTHLLEDASFMRLKNLMVSYSVPKKWLKKTLIISSARLYVQGQNLLTFTGFSGLDPESDANIYKVQYPMSRQFMFGADITF
ncbi:TonB-dependent receptor [Bacteroides sp. 224]|uniref:SusC/RagA family TonB-linked outer membrane protein n=1 Tax=Bacteroides sp. 224 TaxID=2302936 RepID=UPI0013CFABDE|nr:TonB-dependent receptor [Bacteroides sp. 224]NDV65163.1 TonB-dependent receptor [Bacteroides sp. 224]